MIKVEVAACIASLASTTRGSSGTGSIPARQHWHMAHDNGQAPMKTAFILMAQYDGKAVVPVEDVCRDYFAPLTVPEFLRKAMSGEIELPIVRMYGSRQAAKGVPTEDLAIYLDKLIASARKDVQQMREAG